MTLFKGSQAGAAPLQIQLGTSATTPAVVVGYAAQGEGTGTGASRPALTRPTTPGTGTGTVIPMDPIGVQVAQTSLITDFTLAPTLPSVTTGSFNLPFRVRWTTPYRQGLVIPINSYILLYANATGAFVWDGDITWEER